MEFGIAAIIIFIFSLIGLFFLLLQKRGLGVLTGNQIYADKQVQPGKTLFAKSINLMGRPDYIIRRGKSLIPRGGKDRKDTARAIPESSNAVDGVLLAC